MQRSNERLYRGQELNELAAGSAGRRSRGWASLAALEGRGELCGRLGSRASRRGLKYVFVFVWHAITGYWGVVRPGTAGMDQYISRMQFPKISPGVSSLPAAVQSRQPRELRPASTRVRGGRASEAALSAADARALAGVCASPRRPRELPASGRACELALSVAVRELRPVSTRVRGGRREAGVERPRPDLHVVERPRTGRHASSQRQWGGRRMGSGRLDGNYRCLPQRGRASFLLHRCKSRRRYSHFPGNYPTTKCW